MKAEQRRSHLSALATLGLVSVLACLYERDPTGLSDARRSNAASQGGLVYAEERRAVELAQVIPDLAGFVFDTSGNVVVLLTGGGDAPATTSLLRPRFGKELTRGRQRNPQANLIVRTAEYTFLELKEWRDRLMNADVLGVPGVVWLDLDEAQNRVVIGLDLDADPAAVHTLAQDFDVPAEAIEFEVTGPYVPQQTLQDEFRPIQGGIQIQRVSGTSPATCTLGFTAVWQDQDVFLTAGHCSPDPTGPDGVEQFQPTAPLTASDSAAITAIGREIAHTSEPCGNRRCSYSDAAIYGLIADTVPPIPSEPWILGRIARPASGCFPGACDPPVLTLGPSPYWVIDTTHESYVVNDLVSKIGSATGWSQGSVTKTCVDVSPAQGVTLYCQMYASYGQDEGDSGAPILLDIMGGADSTVTLGGIHSGKAGKNAVFSPWSGIVQDYGALSVTARTQAPNWPLLTDSLPRLDTTRLVQLSSGRWLYRANITLRFKDNVSDAEKMGFFDRHGMTVVGVTRSGRFFVGIPDPGPSLDALFGLLDQLNAEPEILVATSLSFSPLEEVHDYRLPADGPGQGRSDWASSTSTWAMRAIRAPLAWGCETGTYGGSLPAVGIFEWKHQRNHPEFAASSPSLWEPPNAALAHLPAASPALVDTMEGHAAATTGLLGAEGDNASGIAGVSWRTGLHLYAGYSSPGNHRLPIPDNFFALAQQIAQDQLRVLSLSADAAVDSTTPVADRERQIRFLAGDIQQLLLDPLPSLIVVVAAGNERYRGSDTAYVTNNRAAVMRAALLLLRSNPTYRDRIIVVTGTIPNNAFWDTWGVDPTQGSNFFTGATDIAAPAQDVTVLDRWTGQTGSAVPLRVATGTSLSAPLVAGVAAQLLAMDRTLTDAELKDAILRGARLPRWNQQTGQMDSAAVTGAPETVYQLDAYGALKLAAERQGAPLCGNRVWVANQQVVAERDAVMHTTESLVNLGEAGGGVHARHGGRRIEVLAQEGTERAFELRQGQWVETQDTATTPAGGTFLSMVARSHDADSAASFRFWTLPGSALFEVNVHDLRTQTRTTVDTLVVPTTGFSSSVCVQLDDQGACTGARPTGAEELVGAELSFPSVGGRLLLALTYFVTRDVALGGWHSCAFPDTTRTAVSCRWLSYEQRTERAELWAVDLGNRQDTLVWTVPDRVFWFGASEDGAQLVSAEGVGTVAWTWRDGANSWEQVWTDPGSISGCAVRYRSMTDGTDVAPAIATTDACTLKLNQGTIAPAPPVSSGAR